MKPLQRTGLRKRGLRGRAGMNIVHAIVHAMFMPCSCHFGGMNSFAQRVILSQTVFEFVVYGRKRARRQVQQERI